MALSKFYKKRLAGIKRVGIKRDLIGFMSAKQFKFERPILMSGRMVIAILEGRKTQTRRIMRLQPTITPQIKQDAKWGIVAVWPGESEFDYFDCHCPYGQSGDRLWVRETWAPVDKAFRGNEMEPPEMVAYRADNSIYGPDNKPAGRVGGDDGITVSRWHPSIFMPRVLSRIKLEIIEVRVEQVQEITEQDVRAEGVEVREFNLFGADTKNRQRIYGLHFKFTWDAINKKRGYGWDKNPWVWIIKFRRVNHGTEE